MNYLFFVLVFPNCFQRAKVEDRRLPEGHPQAGQDENHPQNHHTKLYFNTLRKNLQNRPISPKRKTTLSNQLRLQTPPKNFDPKKKMLHQNLCPGRLPALYPPEPRPESNKISYTDVANPPYRHYQPPVLPYSPSSFRPSNYF